ncbi:hypothetical protein F2Q70_00012430 [Brassica cretica]|uniref:Uncharacterized protein n=1 Tax=Brassica cretica TaxID=69181 RepID=A0A8S9LY22_BRACR|nr:hypothetical protein F2Q70_00012430 [Brassica cretica]
MGLQGPYAAFQGKSTPGTCSDFAFCRSEAGHYLVHMLYSTYDPSVRLTLLSTSGEAGFIPCVPCIVQLIAF